MADHKSRTKEQIFVDMHRELRTWNREIPESSDRMDPVLKILLQLYAQQLARIDQRIDEVWKTAADSLIKSVSPESKRWPVPAFTVMRCKPTDPMVAVDHHTRFFHREERDGGQTFFFSPRRNENLVHAEIKNILLKTDDTLVDMSPSGMEGSSTHTRINLTAPGGKATEIYISLVHDGPPSNFKNAAIFLKGNTDALKQLRWAYWHPCTSAGRFNDSCSFCPGLTSDLETMFSENGQLKLLTVGAQVNAVNEASIAGFAVAVNDVVTLSSWVTLKVNNDTNVNPAVNPHQNPAGPISR